MMKIRKLRRNVKAISPVISVLLMISIAVVASLVAYAWVMGYMNTTTDKVGKSILIQSVDGPHSVIYVQNTGNSAVTFSDISVYVDGVGYSASGSLAAGNTISLDISSSLPSISAGSVVKVVSTDGAFSQVTYYP